MRTFAKKHKLSVFFIALASVFVIIVTIFFTVTPNNKLMFLDMTDPKNCKNIFESFDNGEDITSYGNVLKLSSMEGSRHKKFYIYCDFGGFNTESKLPKSNYRVIEDDTIATDVKVELYLMTNITNTKIVEEMFKFITATQTRRVPQLGGARFTLYFTKSNNSHYIVSHENKFSSTNEIILTQKIIVQYMVIVRHKTNIEVDILTKEYFFAEI